MKEDPGKFEAPGFTIKPRRPLRGEAAELVTLEPPADGPLPAVARPTLRGVDLCAWAGANRDRIQAALLRHGAIRFRDFSVGSAPEFERFIRAVSGQPLPYIERSSPRSPVSGHIFTSTEYPAEHEIFLHCENSYQSIWPLKIFFYCEAPAEQGGETPIADTRRILQRISPHVRRKFNEKGVMYVRNFDAGIGLPWQTVFQTEDRSTVEQYCSRAGIKCDWHGGDRLRTTQVRKAIQTHPITGEHVWFNHAVFFHVSTLEPAIQHALQTSCSEEALPNNTYYGDGSPIEPEVLSHLRAVYNEQTFSFQWRENDILMLDNMLAAHGRYAYRGPRKILVGMTEPYTN
jgi:alpha-ketoglutarate-dependent taurine dioxygenase